MDYVVKQIYPPFAEANFSSVLDSDITKHFANHDMEAFEKENKRNVSISLRKPTNHFDGISRKSI